MPTEIRTTPQEENGKTTPLLSPEMAREGAIGKDGRLILTYGILF
jgi:hypothetical protein